MHGFGFRIQSLKLFRVLGLGPCGREDFPRTSVLVFRFPCATHEEYFIWGYYGTHYRVRFYPPFWV